MIARELSGDIDGESFRFLSQMLSEMSGIYLPDNLKNRTLISVRLAPVLRQLKLDDFRSYCRLLKTTHSTMVQQQFLSAMTTNTTEFFREERHFEVLARQLPKILPPKLKQGSRELRVWCAAASSGQEAYSMLITLLEHLPEEQRWDIKFLATDIDLKVLQRAANAQYTKAELESVPPIYRQKYFSRVAGNRDGRMMVKREVREKIRFAPLNLSAAFFGFQHQFDIIFCRNVLIYFEPAAARGVVERLSQVLAPGGLLFLGHAETVAAKSSPLSVVSHAVYRKGGMP